MKKTILDKSTIDNIILMYRNGNNLTHISKSLDISRKIVKNTIRDSGLSLKTKSDIIRDKIPELKDKTLMSKFYFDDSLSLLDIAEKLNTNEQVVKTAFKMLGIKPRNASEAKIASMFKDYPSLNDVDFLREEYIVKKNSPKIIAKTIGCSSKSVETAIKIFKFKKRSHSESLRFSTPKQRINAKIARNLRTRFWIALNGKSKMASAVLDLGITVDSFKEHFKTLFYDNVDTGEVMTWDNYGKWEIDHHRPLSDFDLSIPEQQREACNYTNLRPLWKKDNRKKSDSVPGQQPTYIPMYIVAGQAGSGKSWVCDQLVGVNYIAFDSIPKEQHYHYMVECSKNGKPIVYDPFRKVSTIYKRYASQFEMHVVLIDEEPEIVLKRLKDRGSKTTISDVEKFSKKMKNLKDIVDFSGTSTEVLNYLKEKLT